MTHKRIFLATSAALTNAVTVGIASTYSSTATESMKAGELNPTDEQVSWIGSILPLGAILGGVIAGYLSDKIGRKGVTMFLSLPLLIGWLLIAYATNLSMVYAGRFVSGVCVGLICVVCPMYIVEISTPEMRGNIGSRFQLFICFGIIISSTVGKFFVWQWVAVAGAVVGVVGVIGMLLVPESPRWLVLNKKEASAVQAMQYLYGRTGEHSVNELVSECMSTETNSRLTPRDLTSPTFYKPAVLAILLMFFQQTSGSNAILYYTVSIFKQASSSIDPAMANLWVAIVMFTFTLLTSMTMDIVGRKKSLYVSGIVTCLSLNVMSVYLVMGERDSAISHKYGWVPLLCLMVYIAGFSIGLGPIPWLMMSEMSPVRYRGLICGIGTACSWIFVFIVTKTFLQLESFVGDFGAYWIYSAFCLILCFFVRFFLPETKGKTLEEIEEYFAAGETMRLSEERQDAGDL